MTGESLVDERSEIDRLAAATQQLDIVEHFLECLGVLAPTEQIKFLAAWIRQELPDLCEVIVWGSLNVGKLLVAVLDEVTQSRINGDLRVTCEWLFIAKDEKLRILNHRPERGIDTIASLRIFLPLIVIDALCGRGKRAVRLKAQVGLCLDVDSDFVGEFLVIAQPDDDLANRALHTQLKTARIFEAVEIGRHWGDDRNR